MIEEAALRSRVNEHRLCLSDPPKASDNNPSEMKGHT